MGKLMHKLTTKTFFLLLILSLTIILSAYGCIWLFLPYADQKLAQRSLDQRTQQFVSCLWMTARDDSEPLFTDFIRQTGAELFLLDSDGDAVSPFTLQKYQKQDWADGGTLPEDRYPFRFADSDDEYVLITRHNPSRSDEIAAAVRKSIPFVALLILLLLSLIHI